MDAPAELIIAHPVTWAYVSRPCDAAPEEMKNLIEQAFCELGGAISNAKIKTHGAPRACYHYHSGAHLGFDLGFPIASADADAARAAGLEVGQTLAGRALRTVHRGPYPSLRSAYQTLAAELKARGYEPGGDIWEVYLNDPDDTAEQDLMTEIRWSVGEQRVEA